MKPITVASTRRLGLSRIAFARWFGGISPGTLRNREQGRRVTEGPARALLKVIEREPEAVRRALGRREVARE